MVVYAVMATELPLQIVQNSNREMLEYVCMTQPTMKLSKRSSSSGHFKESTDAIETTRKYTSPIGCVLNFSDWVLTTHLSSFAHAKQRSPCSVQNRDVTF